MKDTWYLRQAQTVGSVRSKEQRKGESWAVTWRKTKFNATSLLSLLLPLIFKVAVCIGAQTQIKPFIIIPSIILSGKRTVLFLSFSSYSGLPYTFWPSSKCLIPSTFIFEVYTAIQIGCLSELNINCFLTPNYPSWPILGFSKELR